MNLAPVVDVPESSNDFIYKRAFSTNVNEENSVSNITTDSTNNTTNNVAESEELFSSYFDEAEEMLSKMTLEEKVGQMFLARYPSSGVLNEIKNYQPAGYILFGKDFQNETPNSIKKELQDCQNASKIPLALGVDEEGGTVVRVSQ